MYIRVGFFGFILLAVAFMVAFAVAVWAFVVIAAVAVTLAIVAAVRASRRRSLMAARLERAREAQEVRELAAPAPPDWSAVKARTAGLTQSQWLAGRDARTKLWEERP